MEKWHRVIKCEVSKEHYYACDGVTKTKPTPLACVCPRACFFSLLRCFNLCPIPYSSACKLKKRIVKSIVKSITLILQYYLFKFLGIIGK